MNTADLFLAQARERPEAAAIIEAVVCGRWSVIRDREPGRGNRNAATPERTDHRPPTTDHRSLTFAELDDLSARGAAALRASGLRPGDAALVFQPMSAELYVALAALFRAGVVAMFLDPSAGREHIARCCELRPPDAFLGSPRAHLLRLFSPAIRRIPRRFAFGRTWIPGATNWGRALQEATPHHPVEPCVADTPALLTFTSGSTGQPKAAIRTHGLLAAQHQALAESIRLGPGQIDLTTLPIFGLANLASGVTTLIPAGDLRRPGAIDPGPILAQIRRFKPGRAGAAPAFFERLLATGESFPEFAELYTGGAPVFPVLLDRLAQAAPNARVVAVYGSTEAEPIADIERGAISDADRDAMQAGKGLVAGHTVPQIALRILTEQGSGTGESPFPIGPYTATGFDAACCPPGTPGEIVVSGAHVLPGYLHGQGDSETKFRVDGTVWHRTGDSGYQDEAGRLWLLGRTSAKITDTRGTLYPFAVEVAARQTPGIRRAALVGHQGKRILLLEVEPGAPPPASGYPDLAALHTRLAWADLDDIRVWDEIPMDRRHNSKVDYPALKRRL